MLNYVLLFTVKKSTVYIKKTNNAKSPFHAGLLVLAFVSVETRTKKKKKKKKKKKNKNKNTNKKKKKKKKKKTKKKKQTTIQIIKKNCDIILK